MGYNERFVISWKTSLHIHTLYKNMILNRQQKEDFVIDLLNQRISVPEIAKQAHVSFSDIKKIRQKVTGEDNKEKQEEKNKKPLSIPSQAFNLFLEGKSIVQVAIGLYLPAGQVLSPFWLSYAAKHGKVLTDINGKQKEPGYVYRFIWFLEWKLAQDKWF